MLPLQPPTSTCASICLILLNMSSPPSVSFSSSLSPSPSSTDLSFLCSTPVYPCLLSTSVTLMLYVAAITNAPTLYAIEKLPFYESDTISQELVCLLLNTFRFHLHYICTISVPDQALLLFNGDLSQHTLNALHLHGLHTYLEHLEHKLLLLVFLPIYQSMSLANQEQYQTISTSIPDKPQIEVMLTSLPVPPPCSPSSSSISLTSCISSWPVFHTKILGIWVFPRKCLAHGVLCCQVSWRKKNHGISYSNPTLCLPIHTSHSFHLMLSLPQSRSLLRKLLEIPMPPLQGNGSRTPITFVYADLMHLLSAFGPLF